MRVLIASSATGGHIYPALAIADEVRKRDPDAEILFVGAKWEIGTDIVKTAGYRQEFIDVSGFDRKNPLKNFAALRDLARANKEIRRILLSFHPDICIGTGGHVAGPVVRCAKKAGIHTIIQEQNVIPGMANKLAEKYADRVFAGFEATAAYFKEPEKVVFSGNPVRAAFIESADHREECRKKYGIPDGSFCVLIFGGSQGADAINGAAVETAEALFCAGGDVGASVSIVLITGRQLYAGIERKLNEIFGGTRHGGLIVMDYADAIYELYAAADLIVSRAGALTITEIALSGRASILVPSPNVTNNHQYYNAKALADMGAAVLMAEGDIVDGGLAAEIKRRAETPAETEKMGRRAREAAMPDAAEVIVDAIFGS